MHTPLKLVLAVAALGVASASAYGAARGFSDGPQAIQIEPTGAVEFEFTGRPQDYVVPAGVCRVRIEAVGAAGGPSGTSGAPGAGAQAIAGIRVAPGETLRVRVGGWGGSAVGSTAGAGGWNGGGAGGEARGGKAGSGGGGATDVRRRGDGLKDRVIVAAGGSGGAGGAIGGPIGTGGGNGGELGQAGLAVLGSANPATGGKGGTEAAGGDPGRNASDLSVTATAGSRGFGGNGAAGAASGGGGGGGGLYGGGGGGSSKSFSGGHGGGGSGFGPAETEFRAGVGVALGRAKISYDPESLC
jgi:hypothetical protein